MKRWYLEIITCSTLAVEQLQKPQRYHTGFMDLITPGQFIDGQAYVVEENIGLQVRDLAPAGMGPEMSTPTCVIQVPTKVWLEACTLISHIT
jgi:hypothetical protein